MGPSFREEFDKSFLEEFVKVAISKGWDYSKFVGMFPAYEDDEDFQELYQKLEDEFKKSQDDDK